jgi:hypothetical protein
MSTKLQVEWRRSKVLELLSKGDSQSDIANVLKEAWTTSQQTEDKREKIQALSLAKDCYSMKLELLTNAPVVDNAIRFLSKSKGNLKLPTAPHVSSNIGFDVYMQYHK